MWGNLFSGFLGTLIGAIVAYVLMAFHSNQQRKKDATNRMTEMCYKIAFSLALQASELANLAKNIKNRLEQLESEYQKNKINFYDRNRFISIVQDFYLYNELQINVGEASAVILSFNESPADIVECLQDVFISNQQYFRAIACLEKYNAFKREVEGDPGQKMQKILGFLQNNFPGYQEILEDSKRFSTKTFNDFLEKIKKLGILVKISISNDVTEVSPKDKTQ